MWCASKNPYKYTRCSLTKLRTDSMGREIYAFTEHAKQTNSSGTKPQASFSPLGERLHKIPRVRQGMVSSLIVRVPTVETQLLYNGRALVSVKAQATRVPMPTTPARREGLRTPSLSREDQRHVSLVGEVVQTGVECMLVRIHASADKDQAV